MRFPSQLTTVVPATPTHYQIIGDAGHRTLWVMFGLMVASCAIFALSSWNVAISRRIYPFLVTLSAIISALSYFAMASGQATTFNCMKVSTFFPLPAYMSPP